MVDKRNHIISLCRSSLAGGECGMGKRIQDIALYSVLSAGLHHASPTSAWTWTGMVVRNNVHDVAGIYVQGAECGLSAACHTGVPMVWITAEQSPFLVCTSPSLLIRCSDGTT